MGGNQVHLALKRDEYIRPLSIGSNWTILRVGLLFAINGPENTIYGMDFGIGVCNYSLHGPQGLLSYSCPNYYGRTFSNATDGHLAYTGGAAPYYSTVATISGTSRTYRQGLTRSVWGSNATVINFAANTGSTAPRRSMHVIQVTKGTSGTEGWGTTSTTLVAQDWNFDNLLEITEQYNQPAYVGVTAMAVDGASGTGSQNDNAGPLDAISVAWSPMQAALEIYGIVVYRVY